MKVSQDDVLKALSSLEGELVSKASETDIDEPEGALMDEKQHQSEGKLSDESVKPGKAKKSMQKGHDMKKKADSSAEHEEEFNHEEQEEDMKSKKAKKSYEDADHVDEEEEHSEHHGAPSGKPSKSMKMKSAKKSFAEELPDEVTTKIDVSNFLKSLVDHTGDVIDDLRDEVAKSELAHESRYATLEESIEDVQKSQAKIGVVLKAICQRIGIIENAPAAKPKADTVAKGGAAERTFASGLEGQQGAEEGQPLFKGLSNNPIIAKSQIATALCDLVKKGDATDLDVIGFESGGFIKPELVSKLRANLN